MSSITTVKAEIVKVLQTVSGIGNIYDKPRYANSYEKILEFYKYGDNFKGIEFRIIFKSKPDGEDNECLSKYEFTLIHQVNDENSSEYTIDGFIDSISDAFESYKDLGGVVREHLGIETTYNEVQMISNILCHVVKFQLEVKDVY
jgi:hypothetical protein